MDYAATEPQTAPRSQESASKDSSPVAGGPRGPDSAIDAVTIAPRRPHWSQTHKRNDYSGLQPIGAKSSNRGPGRAAAAAAGNGSFPKDRSRPRSDAGRRDKRQYTDPSRVDPSDGARVAQLRASARRHGDRQCHCQQPGIGRRHVKFHAERDREPCLRQHDRRRLQRLRVG